ncbi:HesA/MoeB/ThiF family protein [Pararhodospirillum photometricum]|uniref:Molybdopterin-synthase adenylyltransferase n=1 Tax=Pararhodospirillum photometricum DSM 122 TaxID=1150469 RepID=H6SNW7_PARPM|nr:HesA/MoeB/ThiF family protein [Pararhodospirillum photometricum]CCG07039.1 Molybdopterin biosynthesis protein [Pararhodospirillum photometricum DSM 122]
MTLTDDQILRYSRHILLPEVGGRGQDRLRQARVLVVGAGGLGSPLLYYLAAVGIGTLVVVDGDYVDLSNLQRQILHTTARVDHPKVESAAEALRALNPDVRLELHHDRLSVDNVQALVEDCDLVADCSDNFATRFLVNDACYMARRPLVSAAVLGFEGQLSTYRPHRGGPCYRCLVPALPSSRPTCAEAGVLGSVVGVLGSLQATEVIKELLDIGRSMAGRLMIVDALEGEIRTVRLKPDPECALCGPHPTLKGLDIHRRPSHAAS